MTETKVINKNKRSDTKDLFTVALPMVVSQGSDTVMLFFDRLFLSRLGKMELAASMSGGLTHYALASFFIGLVGYVNAIVAQYYGADRREMCAKATSQSIYLSLLAYPIMLLLVPLMKYFFPAMGHSAEQVVLEYSYFRLLMFGSIFIVLRMSIGGFFIGIGKTRIVMLANIVGMIVNIPFNYVLIFGKLGFPALGMKGAAIGTICGSFTATLILFLVYLSYRYREKFHTNRSWRFRKDLMGKLMKFGFPAGGEMFLGVAAFNIFVQFMHSYGADVAAAVTISFNYDIVAYIPMLGLGIATTSLVGRRLGAKDPIAARRITFLSLKFGYIYSGAMMLLFIAFARPMVLFFSGGFVGDSEFVVPLSITMLRLASLYTIANSTALVFSGALRGAGDTRWVMWISILINWCLAASAFVLVNLLRLHPLVMWACFIGIVIVYGLLTFIRFRGDKWQKIKLID
jgi:multidrug resistance protein, MATE family